MEKTELLLPVGNYQMCLTAIHNGANAVYVGMPGFNARGRSHDHAWEELKEIIDTCHLYGVHVHLAFNILIFEEELSKAMEHLDRAVALGPDAFIIQDIGLISLIKKRYPSVVVHGSTQMTVTNHEAIELLSDLEIDRFVLGRENSISEIQKIKENTNKELEVFVHGALCVAYSGQCFTSEAIGGRSANRGQCAQSCRFNYDIFVDGEKKELGNFQYLVSPQDLCGIEEVPKLMEMGIESFKVEGRLKSPEFVGVVAKNYRHAIDGELESLNQAKQNMATTFSRGLYSGWLHGVAHQELVDGTFKSNRGAFLGHILEVRGKEFSIDGDFENLNSLQNGDGLLIETKNRKGEFKEIGEKIYHKNEKRNKFYFKLGPKVNSDDLKSGYKVYVNRKEALVKEVAQSVSNRDKVRRVPISLDIQGEEGAPLRCLVSDGQNKFEIVSEANLERASSRGLDDSQLIKALGGLSQTAYVLENIKYQSKSGELYIHNRELKNLKQQMVKELNFLRTKVPEHKPLQEAEKKGTIVANKEGGSLLSILVRTAEQLNSLVAFFESDGKDLKPFLKNIVLDFEFGKDYFPSVKKLKEAGIEAIIATTRILKPGEYHNFRLIDRCEPDGLLIRNLGALNFYKDSGLKLYGDFSLNCSNSSTFDYLLTKGLDSICASYDLNLQQLADLTTNIDASSLEITVHQYMPEFHMEHCVFASALSEGNSFRDCGKPCEKHEVFLEDMYGNRHEIKADQECRNTMFNSKAQSTLTYIEGWQNSGVRNFRFEALHENGELLIQKVSSYLSYLAGKIEKSQAASEVGEMESYGLTSGPLTRKTEYVSRKKETH